MKRLFIDLEKLNKCEPITAGCSYYYHPKNSGITRLREIAEFIYVCRKCEEAPCVKACPKEAIEKQEDGIVKRYTMRCISCKSCSMACPFGTIAIDTIPYIISQCDVCIDRSDKEEPACARTCSIEGAIRFLDMEESEKDDIYLIGRHIAVHVMPWKKYHP